MLGIQICAEGEWKAFKKIMDVSKDSMGKTPYGEFALLPIAGQECVFYYSGFTKTRSSGACQHAIDRWKPERIFVLGTCGGVSETLRPLDIVIANKTVQYDCVIRIGDSNPVFYEDFIEEIDNSWIHFEELSVKMHEGLVATADQDFGSEQMGLLSGKDILCADWESGAISHICRVNQVKCCILRGVTDMPKKGEVDSYENQWSDFRKNTPLVMEILINTLLPELIAGHMR